MARRIEKRTDKLVEQVTAKQGRVLPLSGPYFVHVMSRVVDRQFILGEKEKEYFQRLMRAQADFSGLKIVTYAVMSNHFHVLVEVPAPEEIDDEELYRRIEVAQGAVALLEFKQLIQRLVEQGAMKAAEEEKQRVKNRMYDLGAFMQQLKRLFTRWYNRLNDRSGTLWEARYKSVVVEGAGHPLLTMAAYIDLNAVRAGLVNDPKEYRFCGYGEAVAGGQEARDGLTRLQEIMGRSAAWRMVQRTYRKWVYAAGDPAKGGESKQPFTREEVVKVWEADGEMATEELMRCKVRYFCDGVVLGSQAFVEGVFESRREHFGLRRDRGAKKVRCRPLKGMYSLRDLRVKVVT